MPFDKKRYEPEFLGEAFPMLAKSKCQADCKYYGPLKSIP